MKALVSASAIVVFFSSPAMAQEENEKGWYLSMKTGIAMMNDPIVKVTNTVPEDMTGNITAKLLTKDTWAISGETGYDFGGLRLGVEVKYQRNKVNSFVLQQYEGVDITPDNVPADYADDGDFIVDGTTITSSDGASIKIRQIGVMANVAYDIPIGSIFKPYIGAGLGAVGTHMTDGFDNDDDGSVRFAWQLLAGAAVKVTRNLHLTANYSYRETKGGILQYTEGEVYPVHLGKTKTSFVTAGLRATF